MIKTISITAVTIALSVASYATCATHVDMGNHRITNVANPVNNNDVVNKRFFYATLKEGYIRDDANNIVHQISSGLMWQDDLIVQKHWLTAANYNAANYYYTSGDTATTYCSNLSLGGFSDWRLPSLEELKGIVRKSVSNPSISAVFQYTASSVYWSSTTYVGNASAAWVISFSQGTQGNGTKNSIFAVRCVRAGQ
jgi:hypothetical protein